VGEWGYVEGFCGIVKCRDLGIIMASVWPQFGLSLAFVWPLFEMGGYLMSFTQQLMQFVIKHWLMSSAFLGLLILLFIEEARSKGLGTQLSVQKAVDLINHEKAVVLDLRDKNAFKEGHIIDAINIPKADLDQNLNRIINFKQRPVIVVCPNGQQSVQVAQQLKKKGFEKAQALSKGIQGWKNESMPLKKS